MRSLLAPLSLTATLALVAGCGVDHAVTQELVLDDLPGCNPLATSGECMYPFPSDVFTRADEASPTGKRVSLDGSKLPLRDGTVPLDVAPYNLADGFSPVMPILLHFGVDIDTTGLPDQHHVKDSVAADATFAIFDLVTGKRVRHMVEMDKNLRQGKDGRYPLIVRPLEPLAMGHRHVVLIKNRLKDAGGNAIEPSPRFKALRDATPTTSKQLEALRPRYEELFKFADAHGYARADLLLAWDYQVASDDWLLGSILSMREQTLSIIGEKGLSYTITDVMDDPTDDMAKIVFGDFEVPTFIREDDSIVYDAAHHPTLAKTNRKFPFTLLVPKKAKEGKPLPLALLGHGLFGDGRDFLAGQGDGQAIQKLSNQFGIVLIATDWVGLSKPDLPKIATQVTANLDRVTIITDKLQQSLMNNLTLTRLAKNTLPSDPKIKIAANDLVDTSRVYYWGASLGGIQGSGFISLSPDIARAVFGVPGSAWSTMLSRSIDFPPLRTVLEPHYPDPLDFTLGTSLLQARFDHADPANVSKLMFERPLPDAPKGRIVVLEEAIGDSQVPNMATEILARAMGVKLMTPSIDDVDGLETVTSPAMESVLTQYKMKNWNMPAPPEDDVPPDTDNDVHHGMNFLPNVHLQISALWTTGTAQQFCSGPCDPD